MSTLIMKKAQKHLKVEPSLHAEVVRLSAKEERPMYAIVRDAIALYKDVRHRRCESCNKWFFVRDSERGKKRKYCSDACRSKAYRQRKEGK